MPQGFVILCNDIHGMGIIRKLSGLRRRMSGAWEKLKNSPAGQALRNKYVFTSLLFLLWLLFFDQNNLTDRGKTAREYDQLIEEKNYYLKTIEEDRRRINELKTDADNLEKFAREQYLMKKDNEDIFIIVDE